MWNICLSLTFSFYFSKSFHFISLFLACDVGIEPTHRGFGDLTDTLSVSHIFVVSDGLEPPTLASSGDALPTEL